MIVDWVLVMIFFLKVKIKLVKWVRVIVVIFLLIVVVKEFYFLIGFYMVLELRKECFCDVYL